MPKQTMQEPEGLNTEALSLAGRLLIETREELAKADSKAQILLALSGIVIGVVLSGAISGDWSPSDLDRCARILWWVGVGAAAVGIGGLGYAVFPRLLKSDDMRITYFEDVLRYKDRATLAKALNAEVARGDRDVEQLLRLSRVVHRKYSAIQISMGALVVAAVLCVAASLVD